MITYDTFKLKVFKIIAYTSKSYIEPRLKKLSDDFDKPYEKVLEDFDEYTYDYYKGDFITQRDEE